MCTVVISRAAGHAWPVAIAANRDERLERPWDAPAAHWPDHPGIIGGRDRHAGGTWMAIGGGLVAAVLNRPGSLGPAEGFRSRGELPLRALGHPSAAAAAAALAGEDGRLFRPFNLLLADAATAWLLVSDGGRAVAASPLPEGVSMITAIGLDRGETPRARLHLPRFRAEPHPEPGREEAWARLLASADSAPGAGHHGALTIPPVGGYGTVAASLLFLSASGGALWRFAAGRAGEAPFREVALAAGATEAHG
jgi:hypothetical protein